MVKIPTDGAAGANRLIRVAHADRSAPRAKDRVLSVRTRTATGRRESLEDRVRAVMLVEPGSPSLQTIVGGVFDGAGGHEAGETAADLTSAVAVSSAVRGVLSRCGCWLTASVERDILTGALHDANASVAALSRTVEPLRGMASTASVFIMTPGRITTAWVGDSRGYLIGADRAMRLTRDHTEAQRLVDDGHLDPEEAETHPAGHILIEYSGKQSGLRVDAASLELQPDEIAVFVSDGVSGALGDHGIAELTGRCLGGGSSFDSLADRLVREALVMGSTDNASAVCARIIEAEGDHP
ncbi:MAG: serine/threonine-protein phosphatase [Phycisphaera sp.]|nr:MAG: serine/threonine-protein phosphatase [Phycisphaera sp.]